jgi:hypothetical protein
MKFSPEDSAAILAFVERPNSWIRPDIAQAAYKIASADPNEHFQRLAILALEAIMYMLELDGVKPTSIVLIDHLLHPHALTATWNSVKAKGLLTPALAPISMIDRLTHLQVTPEDVRALHFARVVADLRARA